MLLSQLIISGFQFLYLDSLILVPVVEGPSLHGQLLLGPLKSELQSLALGLVLHVLVSELNHLCADGLQLKLLASALLLDQGRDAESLLVPPVELRTLCRQVVPLRQQLLQL